MLGPGFSFQARADVVAGPLAPLASSLGVDLDRLLPDEDFFIPAEKARMTRRGGRCERDGTFLEFDPASPRRHRCPGCGMIFDAEEHYRWWIMGYQLWLSERAVHAAALARLTGDDRHQRLAEAIVNRLADRYLAWPNEDNVLGPTRPFFSTYLESIWLLQLSVAVMILEHGASTPIGEVFRERIALPSSALIHEFNEGLSNRQVWNSAALGATAMLLARPDQLEHAILGPGGLRQFLESGLLSDGSWYEGENYHLFAHRGLWYLARLAEQGGIGVPDELLQRFGDGFVAPLQTALPDFTFPARRDSQYRVSLRQWRIAESLELGLARTPGSIEIAAGLTRLYHEGPTGESQRWRSTGEAERNFPGVRLTRADLGWKSLLFALPELPDQPVIAPRSVLMEGQGFGVIRRDEGRTYVALDYGHTGGGHGHPDRLNFWLVRGDDRVFEDVGTGSYVEQALHWYRSTLAHNAPLVNGRSQDPVAGSLRDWGEHDGYSWIDAEAHIAPGVLVRRSVFVVDTHVVDRLEWTSERDVTLDLPIHLDGELEGATWRNALLSGGSGPEPRLTEPWLTEPWLTEPWLLQDGFGFLEDTHKSDLAGVARIISGNIHGAVHIDAPHEWWRVVAPGPPGTGKRRFLIVRARGPRGCLTSVWSWAGPVRLEPKGPASLRVELPGRRYDHELREARWHREPPYAAVTPRGQHDPVHAPRRLTNAPTPHVVPLLSHDVVLGDLDSRGLGARFELGAANYRRTEANWNDAGSPTAVVRIAATRSDLLIEVAVPNREPNFAKRTAENALDNEHPDTNSDGVQIHLSFLDARAEPQRASWLLVPEHDSLVRIKATNPAGVDIQASWRRVTSGWQLMARVSRDGFAVTRPIGLDVIVNEMPRGRERRRGQLVLSGGGDWAYLRGDRQDVEKLLPFIVKND